MNDLGRVYFKNKDSRETMPEGDSCKGFFVSLLSWETGYIGWWGRNGKKGGKEREKNYRKSKV